MNLLPGTILDGKFRILRSLGHGGMGTVYAATQLDLDRTVAVKVLFSSSDLDDDAQTRFLQESQIISNLRHKNIISVYGFGEIGGHRYIVMEYVEGTPLHVFLAQSKQLSVADSLRIIEQVCSALSHAHNAGVIHRDLKPPNIIIGPDKTVKVIDFGLAKQEHNSAQRLTREGTVLGTVTYMSPEQCQGNDVDARSDIYSCGCVLYQCLTGEPPFPDGEPVAIMMQHVSSPVPKIRFSAAHSEIGAKLQRILDCALAKSATERFQDAEEMQSEIADLLATVPESMTLGTKADTILPKPRAAKMGIAVACSIAVLCGIVANTSLWKAQKDASPKTKLDPRHGWSSVPESYALKQLSDAVEWDSTLKDFIYAPAKRLSLGSAALTRIQSEAMLLRQKGNVREADELLRRALILSENIPPNPKMAKDRLSMTISMLMSSPNQMINKAKLINDVDEVITLPEPDRKQAMLSAIGISNILNGRKEYETTNKLAGKIIRGLGDNFTDAEIADIVGHFVHTSNLAREHLSDGELRKCKRYLEELANRRDNCSVWLNVFDADIPLNPHSAFKASSEIVRQWKDTESQNLYHLRLWRAAYLFDSGHSDDALRAANTLLNDVNRSSVKASGLSEFKAHLVIAIMNWHCAMKQYKAALACLSKFPAEITPNQELRRWTLAVSAAVGLDDMKDAWHYAQECIRSANLKGASVDQAADGYAWAARVAYMKGERKLADDWSKLAVQKMKSVDETRALALQKSIEADSKTPAIPELFDDHLAPIFKSIELAKKQEATGNYKQSLVTNLAAFDLLMSSQVPPETSERCYTSLRDSVRRACLRKDNNSALRLVQCMDKIAAKLDRPKLWAVQVDVNSELNQPEQAFRAVNKFLDHHPKVDEPRTVEFRLRRAIHLREKKIMAQAEKELDALFEDTRKLKTPDPAIAACAEECAIVWLDIKTYLGKFSEIVSSLQEMRPITEPTRKLRLQVYKIRAFRSQNKFKETWREVLDASTFAEDPRAQSVWKRDFYIWAASTASLKGESELADRWSRRALELVRETEPSKVEVYKKGLDANRAVAPQPQLFEKP